MFCLNLFLLIRITKMLGIYLRIHGHQLLERFALAVFQVCIQINNFAIYTFYA